MKKLLIMFLTFALCATIAACAGQGATETTAEPTETTAYSWDAGLNTGSSYGCAIDEYHAD